MVASNVRFSARMLFFGLAPCQTCNMVVNLNRVDKRGQSATLARLNGSEIWGREITYIGFFVNIVLTFVMDALRLDSITWLWFIPSLVSFSAAVALGWLFSLVIRKYSGHPRIWMLNVLFFGLVGATKNVTVGLVAEYVGLVNDATWAYRFLGGVVMGDSLFIFTALAIGARIDHRAAVQELVSLQNTLINRRELLEETVIRENKTLVTKTHEILIPKLRRIEEMLSNVDSLKQVVDELRATIEGDLRPLTRAVSTSGLTGFATLKVHTELKLRRVKLPRMVVLREVIKPGRTILFNTMTLGILMYFFFGFQGVVWSTVAVLCEGLIHAICKSLLSETLIPFRKAMACLTAISLLGALPAFAAALTLAWGHPKYLMAIILVFIVSVGSVLSSGYSSVLDSERSRLEAQIVGENTKLAHEIAVYEQRIWVFGKSWQLLLHGTVQAALTAALTRLNMPTDDEVLRAAMVRQDLARAEVALQATPVRELDLHRTINELSSTWRGVCDVNIKVSERAARALKRSFEVMFGVNEIMREAVSNAVRHGAATQVEIEIDREADDMIDFVAKNNGTPIRDDITKGTGSSMLDELTVEWNLTQDNRLGKTVLRASIPVSL